MSGLPDTTCLKCTETDTELWTVKRGKRSNTVHLCKYHATPLRLVLDNLRPAPARPRPRRMDALEGWTPTGSVLAPVSAPPGALKPPNVAPVADWVPQGDPLAPTHFES